MAETFTATSSTLIDAPVERAWSVITDREAIEEFMFGTKVETDWNVGGPIRWHGMWKGEPYDDKGEIVEFKPDHRLVMTHYSPLTGQPDIPQNYHTVTWSLKKVGEGAKLTLTQDNNASKEAAQHAQDLWDRVVADVKTIAERD